MRFKKTQSVAKTAQSSNSRAFSQRRRPIRQTWADARVAADRQRTISSHRPSPTCFPVAKQLSRASKSFVAQRRRTRTDTTRPERVQHAVREADTGGAGAAVIMQAWNGPSGRPARRQPAQRAERRRPLPPGSSPSKRISRLTDPRRHAILTGLCHLLAMVQGWPMASGRGTSVGGGCHGQSPE